MTTSNTDENSHLTRTSLWSVPERWSGAYLALFVTQTLIWLALLIFNEATAAQPVNIVAKAVDIGVAWAPLMVASAGTSMLIVEVTMVFADKILNLRYKRGIEKGIDLGREEGREEGIEEGIVRGREQGIATGREEGIVAGREEGREQGVLQERARWESYSQAVDEAHRKGEPPPAPPADQDDE